MSSQSRNQDYKYQYKTLAIANSLFCGNGPRLNISVPENLLDIKAIFMHAVLKFDVSVSLVNRKILWAGGDYPHSIDGVPNPSAGNMRYVNVSADPTTRIVDLKIDITDLKEGLMDILPGFDQPNIELNLITNAAQGTVILWKIDFVYTTTGIQ